MEVVCWSGKVEKAERYSAITTKGRCTMPWYCRIWTTVVRCGRNAESLQQRIERIQIMECDGYVQTPQELLVKN